MRQSMLLTCGESGVQLADMLRKISDQNRAVSVITAQNLFPDGNAKAFEYIESIEFIDLLFAGESAFAKCVLFYIKAFRC